MPSVLSSFGTNLTEFDVYRFKVALDLPGPPFLSSDPNFEPDYLWSARREGVTLGQDARVSHGFPVYNFTLPLRCGPVAPGSDLDVFYSAALPPDVAVVNAAMYGAPGRGGYLVSALTREDWVWGELSGASTSVFGGSSAGGGFAFATRLLAIFRLLCTYFLLSTTTALLVRLWIVSLPAFMYLMLACIARFTPAPPDPRVIDDHFPWLGGYAAAARLQDEAAAADAAALLEEGGAAGGAADHQLAAAPAAADGAVAQDAAAATAAGPPAVGGAAAGLDADLIADGGGPRRRRGGGTLLSAILDAAGAGGLAHRRPPTRLPRGAVSALVWAHAQQLLLSLLLYEAATGFAGALAFTYKSFPAELAYVVWTVFFVAEGFSAVYVRSLLGMTVFPRAHFLLFGSLYYYYAAFAYPFATAAAVAYLLAVVALMVGCFVWCEAPAYATGRISAARPRAVLVLLPTAVTVRAGMGAAGGPLEHWAAPPLWSLFMRAAYRPEAAPAAETAYDAPVPPAPGAPQAQQQGDDGGAMAAAAPDGGGRVLGGGGGGGGREGALVRLLDGDAIPAPQLPR